MMGTRMSAISVVLSAAVTATLFAGGCVRRGARIPPHTVEAGRPARLSPDYADCTVPPNIAPLNFTVRETGTAYRVVVRSESGEGFTVSSRTPKVVMPRRQWAALLDLNRGKPLRFDVYAEDRDGAWRHFNTVTNRIAPEDIDPYVLYRRLRPVHTIYTRMGTYQRDVSSYRESPVLISGPGSQRCANCHSFVNGNPDKMCLQIRSHKGGPSMVVVDNGTARKVNTRNRFNTSPASYTSWHPSGRLAAFAAIKVIQFHHTTGNSRDVLDVASDVCLYLADSNEVTSHPAISDPTRLETFPSWSPDGKTLYLCSAEKLWPADTKKDAGVPTRYRDVRYDLVRIAYDATTGEWGELETVLAAAQTGLSISEPRVSPDGRFLVCCMSDYGCFPVFQESSDLYIVDLESGQYRALDVNSNYSDSWHSWSTNGRWLAFASKRDNGLFGRIYFSYVDRDGRAHKPLVLPQRNPEFYTACLDNFNRPELAAKPVAIGHGELARVLAETEAQNTTYTGTLARGTRHKDSGDPQPAAPRKMTPDSQREAFRHFHAGQASEKAGDIGEAVENYRLAVECLPALHPLNIPALQSLAWIYATHPSEQARNPLQAVRLARFAERSARLQLERSPDERIRKTARSTLPSLTDTLAAALAEAGRFEDAARTAMRAETMALEQGQLQSAVEMRSRLDLYLTGKPYRTTRDTVRAAPRHPNS